MKALKLCAVSALALTAAACSHREVQSAATTGRLDCPETAGNLTRISAAADGKSCEYQIADGAQVTLKLMPVGAQGPTALLAKLTADLKAEVAMDKAAKPADAAGGVKAAEVIAQANADADKAWSSDSAAEDPEVSEIERKVEAKLKERGLSDESDPQSAHVRLPGVQIDADDKTDSARVSLPGIHIDAKGDGAAVRVGSINIVSNDESVDLNSVTDTRLRGEGLSKTQRGISAMFVYAGDNLGGGYKYVGYEAAGPKTGPLTVAIVKSRKEGGFHGDVYGDVKRLVRRNGGI